MRGRFVNTIEEILQNLSYFIGLFVVEGPVCYLFFIKKPGRTSMKLLRRSIFLLVLGLCVSAQAVYETVKLANYTAVTEAIQQQKMIFDNNELLVVFDLDDTLLLKVVCSGVDPDLGGFQLFIATVKKCPSDLTSPLALDLINQLKADGYPVMALTARPPWMMSDTLEQLSVRSNFRVTFETAPLFVPEVHEFQFMQPRKNGPPAQKKISIKKGVSFSSNSSKGLALQAFLKGTGKKYKQIVFVDDSQKNIKALEKAFAGTESSILIIHYTEFDD
jgi:phosphoserine phosphatase